MPTQWEDPDVHCPFYRSCSGRNLLCEGIWPNTGNTITFRGPNIRLRHMQQWCMDRYTHCGLYRQIEKNYEE